MATAFLACTIARGGFSCEKCYEFTDIHGTRVTGLDQVIRLRYPDGSEFQESDEKEQRGLLQVEIIVEDRQSGGMIIRHWDCMDSIVSEVHISSLHLLD